MPGRSAFALLGAGAAMLALVAVAFSVGRFPVAPGDLASLLWTQLTGGESGLDPTVQTVVLKIRGPRVVAALVIGAALAAAGGRIRTCSAIRWCRRTSWASPRARR